MERRERIIWCTFSGTLNGSLLKFFNANLEGLIGDLKGSPWGYLSSSLDASVATQEVEDLLLESGLQGLQWGCVAAAYVMTSPIAIAQTQRVRQKMGIPQSIHEVLFDTEDDALAFLNQAIQSVLRKQS